MENTIWYAPEYSVYCSMVGFVECYACHVFGFSRLYLVLSGHYSATIQWNMYILFSQISGGYPTSIFIFLCVIRIHPKLLCQKHWMMKLSLNLQNFVMEADFQLWVTYTPMAEYFFECFLVLPKNFNLLVNDVFLSFIFRWFCVVDNHYLVKTRSDVRKMKSW